MKTEMTIQKIDQLTRGANMLQYRSAVHLIVRIDKLKKEIQQMYVDNEGIVDEQSIEKMVRSAKNELAMFNYLLRLVEYDIKK